MSSKLIIHSAKGKGTTVSFKLPLCKIPDNEKHSGNSTANLGRGAFKDLVTRTLKHPKTGEQKAKSFPPHTCNEIEFEVYATKGTEEAKTTRQIGGLSEKLDRVKTRLQETEKQYLTEPDQIPIEPAVRPCNRSFHRKSSISIESEGIVLIADDYAGNRIVLAQMLAKLRVKSVQARDGVETCRIVKEHLEGSKRNEDIELIFMDLDMPEMDGIQAARNIRRMEDRLNRTKRIPIAVVTAFNTEDDKQICLKAGMQYFYSKPLSFSAIKALAKFHCKAYYENMSEQDVRKAKL
eukprot:TRINITY_DN10629_c0_g3_i2.p1 TRINITY_DN10629_c0_g3~~TRINITY_DN10629_c0_g3_i2.p1  ORF type:complete len:293 (+),score=90.17 TRINITY_DN10629_c0_g3_i2:233-1111(+)